MFDSHMVSLMHVRSFVTSAIRKLTHTKTDIKFQTIAHSLGMHVLRYFRHRIFIPYFFRIVAELSSMVGLNIMWHIHRLCLPLN